MNIKEIKQKTNAELTKELEKLRKELAQQNFNLKSGQVKDTAKNSKLRKEVARILTVLKEAVIKENLTKIK